MKPVLKSPCYPPITSRKKIMPLDFTEAFVKGLVLKYFPGDFPEHSFLCFVTSFILKYL